MWLVKEKIIARSILRYGLEARPEGRKQDTPTIAPSLKLTHNENFTNHIHQKFTKLIFSLKPHSFNNKIMHNIIVPSMLFQ